MHVCARAHVCVYVCVWILLTQINNNEGRKSKLNKSPDKSYEKSQLFFRNFSLPLKEVVLITY